MGGDDQEGVCGSFFLQISPTDIFIKMPIFKEKQLNLGTKSIDWGMVDFFIYAFKVGRLIFFPPFKVLDGYSFS